MTSDDVELYVKIGAAVIGALGTALWGRSWIKRNASSDDLAVASDRARVDITKLWSDEAEKQRVRADRALDERNAALSELGSLRAQVSSLEQHKVDCERRLLVIEERLQALQGIVDRRLN